ncbi:MAG: hypothetical protein ACRD21_17620 [Vicinamibacteria bacterium]
MMKYLQNGGFQNNPLMRLTVSLTLALLLGLWATNFAMYFTRMDLSPASVVTYYNGSEQEFRPARSGASMLETTHMHLPMMGIVLLFLTHLLIFVPLARGPKVALILATFAGAMLDESAGWLVRFVDPAFAPLKVAGFLILQTTLGVVILALAVFLVRAALSGLKNASAEEAEEIGQRVSTPSAISRA